MILNFLKCKIYHLKINYIKTLNLKKNKTKHRSLTLKKKKNRLKNNSKQHKKSSLVFLKGLQTIIWCMCPVLQIGG